MVVLFLSGCAAALGQGKVEIKANVVPILFNNVELSGEYLANRRLGIEAGIGYQWNTYKGGYFDTITQNIVYTRIIENRKVNIYLSGKYYISPKHGNDRFFAGVLVYHQFYTLNTLNGQDKGKPNSTTAVGVEPGYKWLIRQRFPLEIGTRWFVYWQKNKIGENIYNLGLFINGKIGYRFD